MNFDMVGSPNYIFMVYDADQSSFEAPVVVPEGSIQIEDTFESFYTWAGVPYDDTRVLGPQRLPGLHRQRCPVERSVHRRRGGQDRGTGGDLGRHRRRPVRPVLPPACDTFANNNDEALDVNSDAIAFAVLTYAYSTESVNGVPGKQVPGHFEIPAPAGPQGTFVDCSLTRIR